jgi:hypothetical protein
MWSETCGTSSVSTSVVRLEFDSEVKGSNSGVWWQNVSVVKDFRYSMRLIAQTVYYCI